MAVRQLHVGEIVFAEQVDVSPGHGGVSLIRERTMAGLAAAQARGRHGGRKFELTKNQIRLAQSAMANRDTHVAQLCEELDISRATLYRYVALRTFAGIDPALQRAQPGLSEGA